MESITYHGRTAGSLTTMEVTEKGKTDLRHFHDLKCGLSWPMTDLTLPYYCILGQGAVRLRQGTWPLTLLDEAMDESMFNLFNKMFNSMGVLGCSKIYVDVSRKFMNFIDHLDTIRRNFRASQDITIDEAPYAENFIHGYEMIRKWIDPEQLNGLTMAEDSILRKELSGFKKTDRTGKAELYFPAMNALRYVLGAYESNSSPPVLNAPKAARPIAWT
jgi:hypothetical protein